MPLATPLPDSFSVAAESVGGRLDEGEMIATLVLLLNADTRRRLTRSVMR